MIKRTKPTPAEIEQRMDALGLAIVEKRDEAVAFRKESGIEDIWTACEEAYLGIDDTNRSDFAGAKWAKSVSLNGPVTTGASRTDEVKSSAFVRVTSRYVDAATAKICEITLPIDDKAFSIESTPIPELVIGKEDMRPMMGVNGQPVMRQANPEEMQQGQPQQVPMTVKDYVEQALEKANESAKKAERRIYDWMTEAQYPREMRKVIHDAARLGVCVLKGPFPEKRRVQAVYTDPDTGAITLKMEEKIVPSVEWRDPWNIFPDPACGEDVQDGDYIIERDYFSEKKLRALKNRKGYKASRIDKVIAEGPGKIYQEGNDDGKRKKNRYELWTFYGTLSAKDIELFGVEVDECADQVYAIVTLINDTVIRAVLNPLDSGQFPYHVMPWSRRADHWAGVGVAEQVAMPQRLVNAATRRMSDNTGISSGVQLVIDNGSIVPANSRWEITPNKIWLKSSDAIIDDVRKAFLAVELPDRQQQLMNIIMYAFKLAEEASAIPLVTQGQAGETTPQTFGQAELQNNNAHSLLRNIGNTMDDSITEPLVNMFYEWLLLDPDVPNEEKGDFEIHAHGSIVMVERAIQEMTLMQLLGASVNPAFGMDPKKVFAMLLKAKRMDPKDAQYTEEELAKMAQMPPPMPPQVQAAQINAQASIQRAQIAAKATVDKMKMDTDRDRAYVEAESQRTNSAAQIRVEELKIKREIAYLTLQVQKGIEVDKNKIKLADTAARLRVQKELASAQLAAGGHVPQVATPAIEPAGRANPGMAYQQ